MLLGMGIYDSDRYGRPLRPIRSPSRQLSTTCNGPRLCSTILGQRHPIRTSQPDPHLTRHNHSRHRFRSHRRRRHFRAHLPHRWPNPHRRGTRVYPPQPIQIRRRFLGKRSTGRITRFFKSTSFRHAHRSFHLLMNLKPSGMTASEPVIISC